MRIATSKKIHYDSGPNLTPLVDIVMVLLIFLMLVGKFTAQDAYVRSNLPLRQQGAGGATPPPGGFPQEDPLEINLDSPTPDRFVARVGQYKAESAAELNGVFRKLGEDRVAAGKTLEETQVVISPGRNVKYKFLIEVYAAANTAGFRKIGFSTAR